MDWFAFFDAFFHERAPSLSTMLDANGCREGWLQGEFFLHGRSQDLKLKTNAKPQKFDLWCDTPPMIAEIKICGGDYSPKMQGNIEADVNKLAQADGDFERFMILVVDSRTRGTSLARWLIREFDPPHISKRKRQYADSVLVRIWQVQCG